MDRNSFFLNSCWLIEKIQVKLQLSCRASRASLLPFQQRVLDHDYVVNLKIEEETIPTESTDSGEHVRETNKKKQIHFQCLNSF